MPVTFSRRKKASIFQIRLIAGARAWAFRCNGIDPRTSSGKEKIADGEVRAGATEHYRPTSDDPKVTGSSYESD